MIVILAGTLLLFLASEGSAAERQVPGDFANIQDAINTSSEVVGDGMVVGAGSYTGTLLTEGVRSNVEHSFCPDFFSK